MSKKVPTNKKLEDTLAALQQQHTKLEASMEKRHAQIVRLGAEQEVERSAIRSCERQIAETHNRLFVRTVLEPKVVAARKKLVAKIQLSGSEIITVARARALSAEVQADQAALQEICQHPFVFSYDGNKSYSSWEESQSGHLVCTVCNLKETSAGAPEDIYTVFDGDKCLVRRDLRDKKEHLKYVQEWFPLDFLKKLFEASAGGINIVWPKAADKASS